ncbi:MAG: peptidase [Fuerstiella sp.]
MTFSTRRHILKSAAAATAAFTAAPLFLNASDKAGTKAVTVGSGAFVYECQHNWDRVHLPSGYEYGNASHGVTVDAEGLIYITHQGNPGTIFVFDGAGKFVRAFGELHNTGTGKGHGIDIRREGSEEFLYLSPSDSELFFTKMTLSGEVVWNRGRDDLNTDSGGLLDKARRYRPTNTSFRPDGGYYLGDGYGSNYLFEYDKNDRFVRAIGGSGTEAGRFRTPHGQWLDARDGTPKLVVADRANERLQWFDMSGRHVRTMDGFLFPADVDVQGDLMLVPDLYSRITMLDKNNKIAVQLGDDKDWREHVLANKNIRNTPNAWRPGLFVHPHDACFDQDGNIYVVEWVKTGRVTKLVKVS